MLGEGGRSRGTYRGSGLESGIGSSVGDWGWAGDCKGSAGEDGDDLGEMHFGLLVGLEVGGSLGR